MIFASGLSDRIFRSSVLMIATNTPGVPSMPSTPALRTDGVFVSVGGVGVVESIQYQDTYANTPGIRSLQSLRRGRGSATFNGQTIAVAGDIIGDYGWHGYDGTSHQLSAYIRGALDAVVSTGVAPTAISLVTGTNPNSQAVRMIISSRGYVGIGPTTPGQSLTIASYSNLLHLKGSAPAIAFDNTSNASFRFVLQTGSNYFSAARDSGSAIDHILVTDNNRNVGVNVTAQFANGQGVIGIANAAVVPTTVNPTGGGVLYVEAGALKYRGSSGTQSTLAPA